MVRPAGLSGFSGQVVDITHVREYHGVMTSHQSEAGPIPPINEREREHLEAIRTGAQVNRIREQLDAVPSPVHTMWIVRVVSDFVEDEFVEVWCERPMDARAAVMQMLRRRRDDHASMVVGVIDSGLRDS